MFSLKLAAIRAVKVKSAELTKEAMIGLNTQVKRKHILPCCVAFRERGGGNSQY